MSLLIYGKKYANLPKTFFAYSNLPAYVQDEIYTLGMQIVHEHTSYGVCEVRRMVHRQYSLTYVCLTSEVSLNRIRIIKDPRRQLE